MKFVFAVSDIDTLLTLSRYQKESRIHIDIDSGMNRLGLKFENIPEFVKALKVSKNIKVEGIMSHFSDADNEKDSSYTESTN